MVVSRTVTPRYFPILGIPILQGRPFSEEDRLPGHNAVILSDALARRMFPGENPLGRQIQPGRTGEWRTIVGIAANVRNSGLAGKDDPEYYEVRHYGGSVRAGTTILVRSLLSPSGAAGAVRAGVAALDPTLPVEIQSMEQRIGKLSERPRFNTLLLGIFAGLGLLLAAIGLYGVVSFLVAQRREEIGVRMAMGASPGAIARLVLRQAAAWTAAGAVAGAIGALFAVRLVEHLLFRVPATDPWTFAAALGVLGAVALAAAWVPSRRAARLDPMQVLRRE
jgi:predicted permease